MRVDALAAERHFMDHILPVWEALDPAKRGRFYVSADVADYAAKHGLVIPKLALVDTMRGHGPIVVSSNGAMVHAWREEGRRRIALMEHGAGQSFSGDPRWMGGLAAQHPSYAGGIGRPAELFLHPGPHPAARDRARYPDARIEIVGSPKLDTLPKKDPWTPRTVAFSFHWDCNVSPETRNAFIYYREAVAALRGADYRIIGHGHPRILERLRLWYDKKGIEVVEDFRDVCRQADLYVCDNSSTIFEFAATGRPVVVLNAPFYRRDVSHGLRFWDAAHVGRNVDAPHELSRVIDQALSRPQSDADSREDALSRVYAFRSGAAARAAEALMSWA